VLRAPGTNCDIETAFAFESCGATAENLHLFRVLEKPKLLSQYQVLCIPGGFSYGDDVGAGVVFSSQLQGHLSEVIGEFLQADKLVLGICNGFQVLLKAGILPGGAANWPPEANSEPPATLTWNTNGKYTSNWVRLKVLSEQNVFLKGIDSVELPIAHAEGRLAVRDESVVSNWLDQGQIGLCYTSRDESQGAELSQPTAFLEANLNYPENPNGSVGNIAGLSDASGRVLGLMPHPERFIHATQHPRWTRLGLEGDGAGLKIFQNAVDYFAE